METPQGKHLNEKINAILNAEYGVATSTDETKLVPLHENNRAILCATNYPYVITGANVTGIEVLVAEADRQAHGMIGTIREKFVSVKPETVDILMREYGLSLRNAGIIAYLMCSKCESKLLKGLYLREADKSCYFCNVGT